MQGWSEWPTRHGEVKLLRVSESRFDHGWLDASESDRVCGETAAAG